MSFSKACFRNWVYCPRKVQIWSILDIIFFIIWTCGGPSEFPISVLKFQLKRRPQKKIRKKMFFYFIKILDIPRHWSTYLFFANGSYGVLYFYCLKSECPACTPVHSVVSCFYHVYVLRCKIGQSELWFELLCILLEYVGLACWRQLDVTQHSWLHKHLFHVT